MYADLGTRKTVVRMHGWPKEVRFAGNSAKDQAPYPRENDGKSSQRRTSSKANTGPSADRDPLFFARAFAGMIRDDVLKGESILKLKPGEGEPLGDMGMDDEAVNTVQFPLDTDVDSGIVSNAALTLDQAAWQHFIAHKHKHPQVLHKVREISALYANKFKHHKLDMREFDNLLKPLYVEALKHIDFIATTPVSAAFRDFSATWQPDLVFFDEAGHAREASTLIPLARFPSAKAYIFLGDHRQNSPWAHGEHDGEKYLTTSALERADAANAVNAELNMNRRARGGLEKLCSQLFYCGKMVPDPAISAQCLSPSTKELLRYLYSFSPYVKRFLSHIVADVPRLLLDDHSARWEQEEGGTSCYNKCHEFWVKKMMLQLLSFSWFTSVDGKTPGSILIITPYSASKKRYNRMVGRLQKEQASRVDVQTFATAQSLEADFVFVDIVKSSSFTDDPQKLNVALSRAVQGEVILLPARYTRMASRQGGTFCPEWLSRVYKHCEEAAAVCSFRDFQ